MYWKGSKSIQYSEILRRYKDEVKSSHYKEIHKKYFEEKREILFGGEVYDKFSYPLLVIIKLLSAAAAVMLLLKKVLIFFIIAAAVFILFVFREEYKSRIYEKRVEYVFDKSRGERTAKLRLKYLREYNSVVGYFEQMNSNTGKCGDYDGITQKCYCSVTGEEMDYLQLCRCQKAGKCQDCPKFDDFISSIR